MKDNKSPNLFWPVILIGLGIIFMMVNLGMMEPVNFSVLWQLWPLFLVAIGINMLFGHSRWIGGILSALLAVAVIGFLVYAPDLFDILPQPEMITESFAEPLEDATSGKITLDFDRGSLTVGELIDSRNLFEADLTHNEEVTFRTSGDTSRNVRLELDSPGIPDFTSWFQDRNISADVALAVDTPLDLILNLGAGSADLNLTELTLTSLKADSGSGNIEAILPGGSYETDLSSGSGSLTVKMMGGGELDLKANVGSGRIRMTVAQDSSGEIRLESGSGSVNLYLPQDTPIYLTGSTGSGSVNLPDDFVKVSGSDSYSGDSGIWRQQGYSEDDNPLIIRFDIGSGSLNVFYE